MPEIVVDRGVVEDSSTGSRQAVGGIGHQTLVIQRSGPRPTSLEAKGAAKAIGKGAEMSTDTIPLQELLGRIERAVQSSLHLWPVPANAVARLINVSENATFLVEGTNYRSVLRVHRPGYHSRKGIQQELAWSTALARDGT